MDVPRIQKLTGFNLCVSILTGVGPSVKGTKVDEWSSLKDFPVVVRDLRGDRRGF